MTDLFEEVEEQLRSDRYRTLVRKAAPWVVALAGVALAVALGDLAGELSLEQATQLLSDFADSAIDTAIRTAILERAPDAEPQGFAAIAMGKLGSHELNYSSDVDLLLLFDPAILPKRAREDSGEAAGNFKPSEPFKFLSAAPK